MSLLIAAALLGLGTYWLCTSVGVGVGIVLGLTGFAALALGVLARMDARERGHTGLRRSGIARFSPSARASIARDVSRDVALSAAAGAMRAVPGCDGLTVEGDVIEAKIAPTGKSWGELMSVTIKGGTETVVEVRSRPKVRTTLIDYGKNDQNVDAFVRAYERLVARS